MICAATAVAWFFEHRYSAFGVSICLPVCENQSSRTSKRISEYTEANDRKTKQQVYVYQTT